MLGTKIELEDKVHQGKEPFPKYIFFIEKQTKIDKGIEMILNKGIIWQVGGSDDQYISNIFTKDKKKMEQQEWF